MDASTLALLLFLFAFGTFGLLFLASAAQYIPPQTTLTEGALCPWYEGMVNLVPGVALVLTLRLADFEVPRTDPVLFNWIEVVALCVVIPLYLRYSTAARRWRTRADD